METVFVVSSVLMVSLLGLRYFEFVYNEQRVFEMPRTRLDRYTRKFFVLCKEKTKHSLEYLHKDVFLNGLHMVTYLALLIVRFIEKRLHKVTLFLRSFKKSSKGTSSKNSLQHIHRENTVDENTKHYG